MDIILSGYGKMGKEVEKAALARGHRIIAILDRQEDWNNLHIEDARNAIAIDFTMPSVVVGNIRKCFDMHIPIVVGTTGWNDQVANVRKWAEDEGQAIFFASNFSIGVNLMFEVTRALAHLLNLAPDYTIRIEETHHIHKLDSPSGTAIKLAEIILEELKGKYSWVNRPASLPSELGIMSFREDEIPGIHKLICESAADILVIQHEAKNRSGFSNSAVMAAEWLLGRTGFYGMKDLLHLD